LSRVLHSERGRRAPAGPRRDEVAPGRPASRPTTGEVVAIVVIALLGLMLILLLFGERVDQILEIYSHSI
jgi:hypothetical protein